MRNMNEKHDFYLVDELADKLRVSRMTIYRYIKAGKLQAIKIGKEFRIPKDEFERLLSEHSVT
jgi:putative resolvase